MEINSLDEAKSLYKKSKVLITKLKHKEPLTLEEKEALIIILEKATYELYEISQET